MTILGRFLRNLCERLVGIFHEGPRTPPRFEEEIARFRARRPDADAIDWEAFTFGIVDRAYRQGFTRGWEWLQRDWPGPVKSPEQVLEEQAEGVTLAELEARNAHASGSPRSSRLFQEQMAEQEHQRLAALGFRQEVRVRRP